ncbi:hypothetical protein ZWY2020_023949 [Hordeum vulgare]|nr:hypothetical protein ZWY2020_023949 [Hordeum vulgare]
MYGIADMMDDFEAEQTRKFSIKKVCKMGLNFTIANKMKMMREELQGITDQYQKFMLVPDTNAYELKVIEMRETSSTIEASIIGRTEEENKIWVSLSESLGEMYITQLLKLSFLEQSKTARCLYDDVNVTAVTMHDLVHDLARSVMEDEILLAGNDKIIGGNRCHYALLNDCSQPLESRRIRAIRFMGSAEIRLDDAAFSSAKSLRVLDLSECSIHKLTNSIGRFKQLRLLEN